MNDSITLLEQLISFPTVSRTPNTELIAHVRSMLEAHGIQVKLIPSADGANANLEWTETAGAARYDVYRDGAKIAEVFDLVGRTYIDEGLANGTYEYFVRPVSAAEVSGTASNTEEGVIDVPPPPPPILISVTPLPIGKALDIVYEPEAGSTPAAYEIMRRQLPADPTKAPAPRPRRHSATEAWSTARPTSMSCWLSTSRATGAILQTS